MNKLGKRNQTQTALLFPYLFLVHQSHSDYIVVDFAFVLFALAKRDWNANDNGFRENRLTDFILIGRRFRARDDSKFRDSTGTIVRW